MLPRRKIESVTTEATLSVRDSDSRMRAHEAPTSSRDIVLVQLPVPAARKRARSA
jgi:hypothetical protein